MNPYYWFMRISRGWLYCLIFLNFVSLAFFSLDKDENGWGYLYASIVLNIVVSYLVLVFMLMNYEGWSDLKVIDSHEPFHEWVWFYCPQAERWIVGLSFVSWVIPNFMHLFNLHHWLSYCLGIFFIISISWWFLIGCLMIRSFWNRDDSLLLPR